MVQGFVRFVVDNHRFYQRGVKPSGHVVEVVGRKDRDQKREQGRDARCGCGTGTAVFARACCSDGAQACGGLRESPATFAGSGAAAQAPVMNKSMIAAEAPDWPRLARRE